MGKIVGDFDVIEYPPIVDPLLFVEIEGLVPEFVPQFVDSFEQEFLAQEKPEDADEALEHVHKHTSNKS